IHVPFQALDDFLFRRRRDAAQDTPLLVAQLDRQRGLLQDTGLLLGQNDVRHAPPPSPGSLPPPPRGRQRGSAPLQVAIRRNRLPGRAPPDGGALPLPSVARTSAGSGGRTGRIPPPPAPRSSPPCPARCPRTCTARRSTPSAGARRCGR